MVAINFRSTCFYYNYQNSIFIFSLNKYVQEVSVWVLVDIDYIS